MSAFLLWQGTPELGQRVGDIIQYVTGTGVVALIVFAINIRERLVRLEALPRQVDAIAERQQEMGNMILGHAGDIKALQSDVDRIERRRNPRFEPRADE